MRTANAELLAYTRLEWSMIDSLIHIYIYIYIYIIDRVRVLN